MAIICHAKRTTYACGLPLLYRIHTDFQACFVKAVKHFKLKERLYSGENVSVQIKKIDLFLRQIIRRRGHDSLAQLLEELQQ